MIFDFLDLRFETMDSLAPADLARDTQALVETLETQREEIEAPPLSSNANCFEVGFEYAMKNRERTTSPWQMCAKRAKNTLPHRSSGGGHFCP